MHFSPQQIHCPHFKKCLGCCLDEAVDAPPILEEAKKFFSEQGIDPFILW